MSYIEILCIVILSSLSHQTWRQSMALEGLKKFEILTPLIKETKSYLDVYTKSLTEVFNERNKKYKNGESYESINIYTFSAIVIFFSYVENNAVSIKKILLNAYKNKIININSNKKKELLLKDNKKLSFDDVIKITFSILPSVFGDDNYYGKVKNKGFDILFTLRDIRNDAIHPQGLDDFFISLNKLNGKDINQPMVNYVKAMQDLLDFCITAMDKEQKKILAEEKGKLQKKMHQALLMKNK